MPAGRGGIVAGPSVLRPFVLLLGVTPFLLYHVTTGFVPAWLISVISAAQVAAVAWLVTRRQPVHSRAVLVGGAVAIAVGVALMPGLPARSAVLGIGGLCHAVAYLSLLIWFAASLRAGREPIVTSLARRIRRTMPASVVRYTRQVTLAWCVFFCAQIIVSAVLLVFAPVAVWSSFVNLLNLPLIVAMALAEFACRAWLFRGESPTGLVATLAGLRDARGLPRSRR